MTLPPVLRRTPNPGVAARALALCLLLALSLCLLAPAAAGARRRGHLESQVGEQSATGALGGSNGPPASGGEGSPETGAGTPETGTPGAGGGTPEGGTPEGGTPETGNGAPESGAGTHGSERRERREARRQRRERRQALAQAGCSITLQAPEVAAAGAPLALSGAIGCAEAQAESGQTVTLYQKLVGTPGFQPVATATSEAGGAFHLALAALEGNSVFYALAGDARSARSRVQAAPAITIAAPAAGAVLPSERGHASSATAPPAGGAVTFTGTVSPADAGTTVALQRELGDDRWQRIATGHVQPDGDYSVVHAFGRAGKITLRVLVRSHGRFMTSASAPATYTVSGRRHGSAGSPVPSKTVTYALDLTPPPASAPVGETVTFTGTAVPAQEGQKVELERESLSGVHGFRVIATATVGAGSSFSIAHAFRGVGVALLRIGVPAAAGVQSADGEPFKLEVTPR